MQASDGDHCGYNLQRALEVVNALATSVCFARRLQPRKRRPPLTTLRKTCDRWRPPSFARYLSRSLDRARELSRQTTARLGTRTADLLHVAAALEIEADCLYSFDKQQRKLARAVRLKLN